MTQQEQSPQTEAEGRSEWKLSKVSIVKWPKPCMFCGELVIYGPFWYEKGGRGIAHVPCFETGASKGLFNYDDKALTRAPNTPGTNMWYDDMNKTLNYCLAELIKIREALERGREA